MLNSVTLFHCKLTHYTVMCADPPVFMNGAEATMALIRQTKHSMEEINIPRYQSKGSLSTTMKYAIYLWFLLHAAHFRSCGNAKIWNS